MNKRIRIIIGMLGLYLISTAIFWLLFSFLGKSGPKVSQDLSGLASIREKIQAAPKTEVCPTNAAKFTKIERDIWEERRPIAAIIENHADSRPQSGLSRADIVYEAVAEGGITRFLGIFYCGAAAEDVTIGPLRSARVYFINWASEYGTPLFVHFGGANNICHSDDPGQCLSNGTKLPGTVDKRVMALEKLIDMGWRYSNGNALDGGANVSYPAIWRDQTRLGPTAAWEHSAFGSTDLLYKLGLERNFGYKDENGDAWVDSFTSWQFNENAQISGLSATDIKFEFWSNKPDYDVQWKYDAETGLYKRFTGGKEHTDWDFDKPQLTTKNLAIQFIAEEGPVDKELHMYYETIDRGDAMFFINGKMFEGSWEKPSQYERTMYYNADGEEVEFVPGVVWIEALPKGNSVDYN
jgi:hypothetical protein